MKLAEAVERLSINNLNPNIRSLTGDESILGVLEAKTIDGVTIATECYFINYEDSHWIGGIPRLPTDIIISSSMELSEVVDAVCELYKARETTSDDGTSVEDAIRQLEERGLIAYRPSPENLAIWGKYEFHGVNSVITENFSIFRHASGWLAIYADPEHIMHPIKYSRALGDVLHAVLEHYQL